MPTIDGLRNFTNGCLKTRREARTTEVCLIVDNLARAYLKSNMQGTLTQELANPLRAEKDHWRWQTANGAWESREDIRTARENTFLHHQGSLQTRCE